MNNTENINNNVSNVSRIKCFVCGELLRKNAGDESFSNIQTAMYSGTDVNELLDKMLGGNLVNLLESEFKIWCSNCLKIIDSYDEAIVTAMQREQELLELFYNRLTKIGRISVDTSVQQGQIKGDPLDIQEDDTEIAANEPEGSTGDDHIAANEPEESVEDDNIAANEPEGSTEDDNIAANEPEESVEDDYVAINESEESTEEDDYYSFDNVDTNETANNNATLYTCEKCGKIFKKTYMRIHLNTHLNTFEHICDICKKAFKTKAGLQVHIRVHNVNNISRFECKICGKKYSHSTGLKRHMPIHTGEYQFQCDKCGKPFSDYCRYKKHKLGHENHILKCTICEKEMKYASSLSKHMIVHKNGKSHPCPTCGKKFTQRTNMKIHFGAVHEGINRYRRWQCLVCERFLATQSTLQAHMEKKHNAIVVTQPSKLNVSDELVVTADK